MDIKRIARHLVMTHWQVNRAFSGQTLLAIEACIKGSEATHAGEIRFVVEGALDGRPLLKGQSAKQRGIELFSQLRMWDTEHNNGVLIYLLLADRDVEIVADRGIHSKVGSLGWQIICHQMEAAFKAKNYRAGVIAGIHAVTLHLIKHGPASGGTSNNELSDQPLLLDR